MVIPEFTAEVSIYRTKNTYRAAYGILSGGASATVIPQACWLECSLYLPVRKCVEKKDDMYCYWDVECVGWRFVCPPHGRWWDTPASISVMERCITRITLSQVDH